ncbi:MAG: hypothetical protein PUC18_12975 [Prevotellaceae bacterium]|nr:hypothetical protein [Prevotellaceae bacterium]
MAHLIEKSALVAEIERRTDELWELLPDASKVENGSITTSEACNTGKYTALESFRRFIDTLEVKEANLDEVKIGETQIYIEDDGGEPPYDGNQWLDLGCLEYEIPENKFKDGDNVEIIIRKTQKGI